MMKVASILFTLFFSLTLLSLTRVGFADEILATFQCKSYYDNQLRFSLLIDHRFLSRQLSVRKGLDYKTISKQAFEEQLNNLTPKLNSFFLEPIQHTPDIQIATSVKQNYTYFSKVMSASIAPDQNGLSNYNLYLNVVGEETVEGTTDRFQQNLQVYLPNIFTSIVIMPNAEKELNKEEYIQFVYPTNGDTLYIRLLAMSYSLKTNTSRYHQPIKMLCKVDLTR